MTREEIINGLEIYTVGRLKKNRVHITVEELQKFIDAIKALPEPTIPLSVIEKIKAEIERESDYKPYEMYDMKWAFNKALGIIDKAVKEIEHEED